MLTEPEQPLFPNSKVPRPEVMTILLTAFVPVTLTTYFILTFLPNTSNDARLKVLEAVIANFRFLNDLDSFFSYYYSLYIFFFVFLVIL